MGYNFLEIYVIVVHVVYGEVYRDCWSVITLYQSCGPTKFLFPLAQLAGDGLVICKKLGKLERAWLTLHLYCQIKNYPDSVVV